MTLANLNLARPTAPRRGLRPALTLTIAALFGGVVATGYAMGQAETLDTDGDGMVSYTELLMAMPDMSQEEFLALDANADGLLDADELAAAEEAGLISMG